MYHKRKDGKGVVYFIRCGDVYKIGATRDLKSRIAAIQTTNPIKCEVVHSIKTNDMKLTERLVQSFYEHRRVMGEWFSLTTLDVFNLKTGNYPNRITESAGNTQEWTRIPSVI